MLFVHYCTLKSIRPKRELVWNERRKADIGRKRDRDSKK